MSADNPVIGDARAIEIATAAASEHVDLSAPDDVVVRRDGHVVTVTFPVRHAPGVREADWDARVKIDAGSGDVIELLGG